MNNSVFTLSGKLFLALLPVVLVACKSEQTVSFAADVKPTLDTYCVDCHQNGGEGFLASGLDMSDYQGLMKGTVNGPMVIPGDSLGSNLVVLMEGRADPSIKMPHGGSNEVSTAEINTIKAWIDQGAENN